jgi:hypothetical protein
MMSIIRGMTQQPAESCDRNVATAVTNFLFARSSDNFALKEDLVVRNIQRARDHSIQGWAAYR